MPEQELAGMPKRDHASELAIEILEAKERIKKAKEEVDHLQTEFGVEMDRQNRASIRVQHGKKFYTLELHHIEEHDIIRIVKG